MHSPRVVIASRLLPPLLQHAAASGVDVAALCARHKIDISKPDGKADRRPDAEPASAALSTGIDISVEAQIALFDDVAAALDDDALGARLGMNIPRGTYGLLEFAAHIGPDLRAVVDVTIDTTPLVSPVVRIGLDVHSGRAHLMHHVDVDGGYGRHAAEMTVAAIYTGGRRAVGDGLVWREAWFAHAAPAAATAARVEALFGCPVRYGAAHNGFSFDEAMLKLPTRMHDDALHTFLRAQAAKEMERSPRAALDPFAAQVADVVRRALAARGSLEMDVVARALAVSSRTLQRRLAERGTSLSRVVDQVRDSEARRLLQDPERRVEEVADALGFADVSAFGRAFKRWTGQTPTTWRQQLR